jgi:hypothetical protein
MIKEMDDEKGYYSHGDQIRGLYINLGNAEIESNGHRSGVGPIEFMKIL